MYDITVEGWNPSESSKRKKMKIEELLSVIELPSQKTRKWLENCLPDTFKTAYIRNKPNK